MEYAQDDYLMISGIQHFKFCRRQWALIHIEQQWAENAHTVIGELMHKKSTRSITDRKAQRCHYCQGVTDLFQRNGS